MRVKLTAKHPRPASSERAPVRTGSTSARKPTPRPAGPKPSAPGAGAARGEGAGPRGGGASAAKRPAAGKPAGGARGPRDAAAGARPPRAEGSFSRDRNAGAPGATGDKARRSTSERPPRRDDASGAPRSFSGSGERGPRGASGSGNSERAPRRFEGSADRSERPPRRIDGERTERAPRRTEDGAGRSERAPRRADGERTERAPRSFSGSADRNDRPPRRADGERPRFSRDEGERRPFSGPRAGAGAPRPSAGARGERPARRDGEAADRPRFGGERGAPPARRSSERPARADGAPRRFDGERAPRRDERAPSERGERTFARPVKSGNVDRTSERPADRAANRTERTERSERPPRAPRDERGDRGERSARAPATRESGARPARAPGSERGERPARSDGPGSPAARRPAGVDAWRGPSVSVSPKAPLKAKLKAKAKANANAGIYTDPNAAPRTPRRDYEDAPGTLRLSKLMSELGLCSRREADEWIEKGWVLVDGERIDTLGTKVRADQRIEIDPAAQAEQAGQVTVLIHKTIGFVSGQAEDGYQPAITLVTPENRWEGDRSDIRFSVAHLRQLAPAGRLDIDSTGLLVLTQDGRVAKQLIGGHSEIDKEYLVRVAYGEHTVDVESHFPAESLALLRHGLSLDDVPLKTAMVSWQNGEQLRFVLREGKKRQIRRMCEAVGLEVVGLKRVRMGRVALGALPPGQWRYLSADESF